MVAAVVCIYEVVIVEGRKIFVESVSAGEKVLGCQKFVFGSVPFAIRCAMQRVISPARGGVMMAYHTGREW